MHWLAYLGALGTRAASVPAVLSPVVPSSPIPNNETRTIAMETGRPAATRPPDFSKPAFALAATGQQLFQERALFRLSRGPDWREAGAAPALAPRVAERLRIQHWNQDSGKPRMKRIAGGRHCRQSLERRSS